MYEKVFHLGARPFAATPFVQNYFPAESIHTALGQARMCIDRASGPVIVTGTSGTGKSLLMGMLAEQLKADYKVISIGCARLVERKDLLQNILFELKLPYRDQSEGELRLSLIDYLKLNENENNGLLLLVDEAHSLSTELLDELRLITNFVRDGQPGVFLVMAGLPSLEDHLIDTKSESFNQRIAARCYLRNLGRKETIEYVLTHIERAGGNGEELFTAEALKVIHQASDGCPRVINQICDFSLVLAASTDSPRVTADIARESWHNIQAIPGQAIGDESDNSCVEQQSAAIESNTGENTLSIEFGHLDVEDSSETQSIVETEDSYIEFGPIDEPRTTIPIDGSMQFVDTTSSEVQQPQADLADIDYSISGDDYDVDRPQNFSNPFDEEFNEEERVASAYYPVVSEQNLSSLTLKPEQLGFLDDVPAGPPVTASMMEPAEAQIEQLSPAPDSDSDLRISESCLPDLDQLEDDVRLLQQHLNVSAIQQGFANGQTFTSKAMDQPIEELMQHHPVADDRSHEAPELVEEPISVNSSCGSGEQECVEQRQDDRDIMIIDGIGQFPGSNPIETVTEQESNMATSTGNAKRMDYDHLFQQLRTPEQ